MLCRNWEVRVANEFYFVCNKLRFIFRLFVRNVFTWTSEIYRASEALFNAGF